MMVDGRVQKVPRSDARKALAKATEFAATAHDAVIAKRWNAAGLAAVHAGISTADAALIAKDGIRSASQDHSAVLDVLDARVAQFSAVQRRQLAGLLKMKSVIAYEQRLITETEARQLVDHARRLLKWAADVVG